MFVGYLFLRLEDGCKICQINPSQTLMNLQYFYVYIYIYKQASCRCYCNAVLLSSFFPCAVIGPCDVFLPPTALILAMVSINLLNPISTLEIDQIPGI